MENHLHRKEDGQQRFGAKGPNFFSIILDDTLQSGRLVMPKRFIRIYGGDLSNVVLVKVSSGDVWTMEIQRCDDGTIWLGEGWGDFASFYSLQRGHFLVFSYKLGSSEFRVLIFDKSATEIKYPMAGKSDRTVLPSVKMELSSDDDRDVIGETMPEQFQPRNKTSRCRSPSLSSPRAPKKLKVLRTNKASCSGLGKGDGKKSKRPKLMPMSVNESKQMRSLGAAEKAEALLRAKSFRSSNPYVVMVMQPSYVSSKYILYLPGKFLHIQLPEKSGVAKLCISNGRTWTVRYLIGVYGNNVQARMFHGWKAFAEENKLMVGDVCVFEWIRGDKDLSFKVTIFKAPEITNSRCSYDESRKIACNRHGAGNHKQKLAGRNYPRACPIPSSGFVSKYPFFQVVIRSGSLSHRLLSVPVSFVKRHFNNELGEQILTLKVSSRSWPVELWSYPVNACMSSGLAAFMKDNSLKAGDICTFELINKKQMVLRVSILRHNY